MRQSKNILIAPLNWGLGHATRCIPIIKDLQRQGYCIIIASDGDALKLLQEEFPELAFEKLPSYNITYAKRSWLNRWHLFKQLLHIIRTVKQERQLTDELIKKYDLDLIISDNRFGIYSPKIKSIYITHQLKVLSGWTTKITTWIHAKIYNKYDEIWVPDVAGEPNLSGKLGHFSKSNKLKVRYIGILSRMKPKNLPKKYDVLAILSGPEPQRSQLEKKILNQFKTLNLKTVLVRGIVNKNKKVENQHNTTIYDYMTGKELEQLVNQSEAVICRSGYSSVMDMASMRKKILMIPTPGQDEQEYLARHLAQHFQIKIQNQHKLNISKKTLAKLHLININIKTQKIKHLFT